MSISGEREYSGSERREFPRLKVNINVDYTVVATDSPRHRYLSRNISGGGICVTVDEPLEIGVYLYLVMLLPDNKTPISSLGRVAWREKISPLDSGQKMSYDVGVEFIDIEKSEQERITRYVETGLRKE